MPFDVDYHAIAPELILAGTTLVVLGLDLLLRAPRKWLAMPVSFLGTAAALAVTLTLIGENRSSFGGTYVVDSFAVLFKIFFLIVALVVFLISLRYFQDGDYYQGEYYFLVLTSFLGMLTISSSRDLLMLFISLELVTAPGFLIAGFKKGDPRSNEAALKFFLIGILSTAVMLYGMSLIYGITGSLRLNFIAEQLEYGFGPGAGLLGRSTIGNPTLTSELVPLSEPLAIAAILFVVAGFAFKVSSVPFHFWAPDTYEGAPIPVAAFLSVASKAAGFAGLLQIMFVAFAPLADVWAPVFAVLSVLTMSLGNLIALQQRQVVRLLAYSSIAQAGYMLLPFALVGASAAVDRQAFSAAMLYILIYGVMNLGAFAVVIALARDAPRMLVEDFAGLGQRAAGLAIPMAIFLVSLAGIPPTAGFMAKLFIIRVAINADQAWLAIVMVVNSVVSLYYYVSIVRQMFFVRLPEPRPLTAPALVTGVVALATAAVVAVGILPDLFAQFPSEATLP
jgi:NADH-quinone oxidoreductase subunit N